MTIGLMGGTFDPIHNAHIMIAETAQAECGLDMVLFIPTGDPPHKRDISDKHHRLAMTRLAVAGRTGFEVSSIEVDREGVTYTVDTLRELSGIYGAELRFIVGSDTLIELGLWRDIDAVMKMCGFIAFHRDHIGLDRALSQSAWMEERFSKKPILLPVSAPDISSTEIRERVARGEDVSGMVPAEVMNYIHLHGLYTAD